MGHRLSKIVTKTGDTGTTGLGDGKRIKKNDARIEAIGSIDELNSSLGLLISHLPDSLDKRIKETLSQIQHDLFDLGGELCLSNTALINLGQITELETVLTALNDQLPPLKDFILPGGNTAASVCHLVRSICRRAERRLVSLNEHESLNSSSLIYINRLSDLLFVIARLLARHNGDKEVLWEHEKVQKP